MYMSVCMYESWRQPNYTQTDSQARESGVSAKCKYMYTLFCYIKIGSHTWMSDASPKWMNRCKLQLSWIWTWLTASCIGMYVCMYAYKWMNHCVLQLLCIQFNCVAHVCTCMYVCIYLRMYCKKNRIIVWSNMPWVYIVWSNMPWVYIVWSNMPWVYIVWSNMPWVYTRRRHMMYAAI